MCRTGLCRFGIGNWIFLLVCLHLFTCIQGAPESEAGVSFSAEPEDAAAEAGARVLLACSAHTTARAHRLAWRHAQHHPPSRDHTITDFSTRKQLPNGSLVIESLDAALAGHYQCVVSIEGIGTMVSRTATVFLAEVPAVTYKWQRVEAVATQRALLSCAVDAPARPAHALQLRRDWPRAHPHPPTVYLNASWFKNGVPVTSEGARVVVVEGGGLELDPAEPRDAGNYSCVLGLASGNGPTKKSTDIELVVSSMEAQTDGAPRIVTAPRDVAVLEGGAAVLECVAVGDPPPTITWLHDGVAIDLNGELGRVWWSGAALVVRTARGSDAGVYTCRAHNDRDAADAAADLAVLTPPSVAPRAGGAVVRARARGGATLSCSVWGRPPPRLTWLKDGEPVTPNVRDITTPDRWSVRIQGVLREDAGVWQCAATSAAGGAIAALRLTLDHDENVQNAETKTKIDSRKFLNSLITTNDIETRHFNSTEAIANDSLDKSPEGSDFLGETSSAYTDDDYYDINEYLDYSNTNATLHAALDLLEEKPVNASVVSAPKELRAVIVKHRFVTLTWQEPDVRNDHIIGYVIIYNVEGSNRERMWWSEGGRLESNVASLQPNTSYQFTVRAATHHALSPASQMISVRTAALETTEGGVRDLRAQPTSPRAVTLSWVPGEGGEGASPPHYTVLYTELGGQREQSVTVTASPAGDGRVAAVLRALRPGATYTVRVAAPDQPASPPIQVVTKPAPPAHAPANVTARAHHQKIIVTWESVGGRSRSLTGYKVRYRAAPAPAPAPAPAATVTTPADVTRAEITALDPATTYQVRVCAINGAGAGPYSEWVTATRETRQVDKMLPPKPPPLKTRSGRDWVSVWWGGGGDDVTTGYSLGWGLGVPDEHTRDLARGTTRHTLTPLKPNSEYVISLRGSNALGLGPAVYATVRTKPGGEGDEDDDLDLDEEGGEDDDEGEGEPPLLPPVGVKVIMLSGSTAVVYWTDPTLPKGDEASDGRRYVVRWNVAGGSKSRTYNATDRNCMLDDLKPYTLYEFAVRLIKGGRSSAWSLLVSNRSLEAAPASAPRELRAAPAPPPARAVDLTWAPPAKPNGIITGYVVMYAVNSATPSWAALWVPGGSGAGAGAARVDRLRARTTYLFKVQARNNKGLGPFCAPVSLLTGDVEVGSGGGVGGATAAWLWASAGGACCVLALGAALAASLCCRRTTHHHTSTYQKSSASAGIKPPDLWIHHDQMELKHMDKHASQAMSASSMEGMCRPPAEYEAARPPPAPPAAPAAPASLDRRHYVPTYVDRRSTSCGASDDTAVLRDSPLSCTMYSMGGPSCGGTCDRRPHRGCFPDQSTPLVSSVGPLGSPHSSMASLACGAASCPLGAACTAPGAGGGVVGGGMAGGGTAGAGAGAGLVAPGGDIYACAARERGHYVAYEPLGHYTHRDSSSSSPPPSSGGVSNMGADRGGGMGTMERSMGTVERSMGTMERMAPLSGMSMERCGGVAGGSMERAAPRGGARLHSFADAASDRSTPPCKGSIGDTSPYKKSSNSSPAHIPNRLHLGGGSVVGCAEELEPLSPSRSTERLHREMQNLEGLMKDLSAITHHHFHC